MANMQIEILQSKQETDERELKKLLDEINALKVKSWTIAVIQCSVSILFSS